MYEENIFMTLYRGDSRRYSITSDETLLRVIDNEEGSSAGRVRVEIIACNNKDKVGGRYSIFLSDVHPITGKEFFDMYPNAAKIAGYDDLFKDTHPLVDRSNVYMRDVVKGEEFSLDEKQREELLQEMLPLLDEYDYHPSMKGCNKIIDEWVKNKGDLILLMSKHPNYNGKYQIVFDKDYSRRCDSDVVKSFVDYIYQWKGFRGILKEYNIGFHSYEESNDIVNKLERIIGSYDSIRRFGGLIPNDYYKECVKSLVFFRKKVERFEADLEKGLCSSIGFLENLYTTESAKEYRVAKQFLEHLSYYNEQFINESMATALSKLYPSLKAVKGQRTSRVVNKFCHLIGIDSDSEYQRKFAQYSDAINPLNITRHTVISCHPIDYFTMSFGNSWSSCHTIDKENKRGMPGHGYEGCYSGGTLSYMLDGTTMVFYTVDKSYSGNQLELEPKINRNMFHLGEDKIVQGRIYPQATDGESGFYKEVREVMQKVIADSMDRPNVWANKKGTNACEEVTMSEGVHYKDYLCYGDCNVSYLKNALGQVNTNKIRIGHNPICPCCGEEHFEEAIIECRKCYEDMTVCNRCNEETDIDQMHCIDGEWYCEDCCFYCQYHDEWEVGSGTYVYSYGDVCDSALEEGNFQRCDRCDDYYLVDSNSVETEDDQHYCSTVCVHRDGYYMVGNGKWYPEEEVHQCNVCGSTVHDISWDSEHNCCTECADKILEDDVSGAGENTPAA